MNGTFFQLMNPKTLVMLSVWNSIKDKHIVEVDDNCFVDIMVKLGVDNSRMSLYLQAFQTVRSMLLAADLDTWADALDESNQVKLWSMLVEIVSLSKYGSPSDIKSGNSVLVEHSVDNNNNNKDDNNNNNDECLNSNVWNYQV